MNRLRTSREENKTGGNKTRKVVKGHVDRCILSSEEDVQDQIKKE
jgi:hypothetical protein